MRISEEGMARIRVLGGREPLLPMPRTPLN